MADEVMVVEMPNDVLASTPVDPNAALRAVYRYYTFKSREEADREPSTRIVAVDAGAAPPDPVSRRDHTSNPLNPIYARFFDRNKRPGRLTKVKLDGKHLIFVFSLD
jgi:hypothetical protein